MEESTNPQSDHDLLVRIDERTRAFHTALEGKLDRGAFESHAKQDKIDFDSIRASLVAISTAAEDTRTQVIKIMTLIGIVGASAGILISHFWK